MQVSTALILGVNELRSAKQLGQSHLKWGKNGYLGGEAMPKKPLEAIEEHFSKVTDPRKDRTKEHKLIDIIAIAICAVICGAEGWVDIELFGKSKLYC